VFFDMDGVLCNFDAHRDLGNDPEGVGFFLGLSPFQEGIDLYLELLRAGHLVLIASTPSWSSPSSWSEKRVWVEEHLGDAGKKALILTHRKDLLVGHYLIDDRTKNGAGEFPGTLILFGSPGFPDWRSVRKFFVSEGLLPELP
jgi:5'-nucleotidase